MKDLDQYPGCILAGLAVLAFVAFVAFNSGDEVQRLLGLIGLLLFGGLGLGFAVGVYATKRPGPAHNASVELPDATTTPAFVIPASPGRQRAGAVGMGFVALGCALVSLNPGVLPPRYAGYQWGFGAAAIIIAITAASALRAWHQRDAFVALSPRGIIVRSVGSGSFVPWDAIEAVEPARLRGILALGIRAAWPDAILRTGGNRLLGSLDRPMTGYDLVVLLSGLAVSAEEIVRIAIFYHEHPKERTGLGNAELASAAPGDA